jgi:hypothetical protein
MNDNPHRSRMTRARRRVALLGIIAVLFQAVLFGWHHHALGPASRGSQPVAAVSNPAAPLSPAGAEDDCDVCMALHHLSASPGEFVALPVPATAASALHLPELVRIARVSERGFHARAPPPAPNHRI